MSGAGSGREALQSVAVTVDLVVFVPAVWWFLVIRRGGATLRTLIPVTLLSIAGARLVLPREQQGLLPWARWLLAPFEAIAIAWIAWGVRAMVRHRTAERAAKGEQADQGHDLIADVWSILAPTFGTGPVTRTFVTEVALMYYAFASWGRSPHVPSGARAIDLERNDGLLIGIACALLTETIALHLFISSRWGPIPAWTLTATSIYSLLWLVGDARAMSLRPPYVTADAIVLRHGVRADAAVPRSLLQTIERVNWQTIPPNAPDYVNLTRPGEPNAVLHFAKPIDMRLLFGRTQRVTRVGLRAARVHDLESALQLDHGHAFGQRSLRA